MKNLSLLSIVLGCSLVLTACSSDTDTVKNGFFENMSKSISIGDAFDHYKFCQNPKWEEFESDRNERIVRFSCSTPAVTKVYQDAVDQAGLRPKAEKIKELTACINAKNDKSESCKKEYDDISRQVSFSKHLVNPEITDSYLIAEFGISKQNSSEFELLGFWTSLCWADGKCAELNHGDDAINTLNNIYTNSDVSAVTDLFTLYKMHSERK